MPYTDIITIEPGKRGGKPCIRRLRITVYDVLEYLASGMSHADVLREFPYLTEEDIRACLAYAADRERKLLAGRRSQMQLPIGKGQGECRRRDAAGEPRHRGVHRAVDRLGDRWRRRRSGGTRCF